MAPTTAQREMLTPQEVADRLGLSRQGVYNAIARGEIPATKIGVKVLIPRRYVDEITMAAS